MPSITSAINVPAPADTPVRRTAPGAQFPARLSSRSSSGNWEAAMSDLLGRSILFTGARGDLGDGLVRAFAGAGAEVLAVSRSTGNVQVPGVRYESADLAEESSAAALLARVPTPWAVSNT